MRILAFTNCPLDAALGSGKTVLRWSDGLRALGHTVKVVADEKFRLAPQMRRAKSWRQVMGAWWHGPRLIRDFQPDVIEFYGAEFGWLVHSLRQRPRRPLLVAHLNGLDGLAHELVHPGAPDTARTGGPWRAWDTLCFGGVDHVAALCQADMDYVVHRNWKRQEQCAVVEPGLEPAFLAPVNDQPRENLLVYSGSWIERKDPPVIVGAVTALLGEDSGCRFAVLGAAADADRVRTAFPEELRSRIHVHGRLTEAEMAAVLRRARVFLFPSRYEGYGMALAEAMACGCAAVTTPTGLGAQLRDGEEALLCPIGDAAAVHQAARKLLNDEPLRRRVAQGGRARVAGLTWSVQNEALEKLYQRWLASRLQTMPAGQS